MQVSVENTSALGRKMVVEIPGDQINGKVDGRLRELGGQVRLKGFRPGRIPFGVLRQRFGAQVRDEVLADAFQESFQAAMEQEKLEAASAPEVVSRDDGEGGSVAFTVAFEIFPVVGEVDVSSIELERPVAEVADSDIDEMIETLRLQRRNWEDVERGAEKGDLALIEFVAQGDDLRYPAEGEERAGGILGKGALFDDLESELIGCKKGEEKEVSLTFPDDFRTPELAGKTASVSYKVIRVAEESLPEVDDNFIMSFGIADGDHQRFREDVLDNLQRELTNHINGKLKNDVIEALVESRSDLELPEGLIKSETDSMREQTISQAQQMGIDQPEAPSDESLRDGAEKRVRASLLLRHLAQDAEMEIDMGRVRDTVNSHASTYDDPAEVVEYYYKTPELLGAVQQQVLEEQIVEWVLERAQVTDVQSTFTQLLRPGANSDDAG